VTPLITEESSGRGTSKQSGSKLYEMVMAPWRPLTAATATATTSTVRELLGGASRYWIDPSRQCLQRNVHIKATPSPLSEGDAFHSTSTPVSLEALSAGLYSTASRSVLFFSH
jgi:hypothetical protein